MEDVPGVLLASGRAANVYLLEDGMVLRRYRTDHDSEPEAMAMRWLHAEGIAVPQVHRTDGRDMVMERIDGPTMLDDLRQRPWMVVPHGRTMAMLQRGINALTAPSGWPRRDGVPTGDRVVHLDLHPMNIILSPSGPVVIDWTNACRSTAAFDAAMSVVIMASVEVTTRIDRLGRRVIVDSFRWSRGRSTIAAGLPDAIDRRLLDPNTTPGERARLETMRRHTG